MNFRVNLAVALAAAFSFACADKPAAIPELEEAMKAPPGMQVIGLYRMDVTPVPGSGGRQFYVATVPVAKNGDPLTNPVNTIQVAGTFAAATTLAGPGACAGTPTLTAPVAVTNFAIDPLTNVWVDVTTTMPVGFKACNAYTGAVSGFTPGAANDGLWSYPNLAGATVATSPGGAATVTWAFNYPSAAPFGFFFRVMAEVNNPTPTGAATAGPTIPLTWRSPVSSQSVLEICSQDPGTASLTPACPVALTASVPSTGTGIGLGGTAPFDFSYAFPTALVDGQTYWYRVRNVFAAGTSVFPSPWAIFTYSAGGPVVAPATFVANGALSPTYAAFLEWTTNPLQFDTWAVVCSPACPPARPVAANPAVLFDGAVMSLMQVGGRSFYDLDVLPLLAADPITGYFDTTATYDVRIYDYDGIAVPTFAAAHSTGSITITPVQTAPVVTPAAPASFSAAALTWPISVQADPQFVDTLLDVCVPDCTIDPPTGLGTSITPPGGFLVPMAAGVGTIDLKATLGLAAPAAGQTFEVLAYNPDLFRVFPIPPVTPAIYTVTP